MNFNPKLLPVEFFDPAAQFSEKNSCKSSMMKKMLSIFNKSSLESKIIAMVRILMKVASTQHIERLNLDNIFYSRHVLLSTFDSEFCFLVIA